MQPEKYLQQVAHELKRINTSSELNKILDEVEFLYEVLEPEFQDLTTNLMEQIDTKLKAQ